jgi:predicted glycogen debranching enzyme
MSIPKIIHQLWIGTKPAPITLMNTWKEKNPDFKVSLSTEELIPAELNDIWYQEKKLRKKSNLGLSKIIKSDSSILLNRLNNARKDFLVKIDSENYSVIAGYHWFNSWGRDTFIALPGLLLKTKEKKIESPPHVATFKKDACGLI